ncbi:MAG: EFR1 family ferrodoxin [Oscillospiraceae bacterium]|nr:EFR1 family ferrodoxin [Oscillospiraceae bacterium]
MKILYFTGTGNCLSVAKHFDAELLSIPQLVKDNIYEIEDDTVGIVYPVYAISIPDIVRKYLSQCKIKANYVFVIATYGFVNCGSLHEMKKLLESNGNNADYYNSLLMVDNYLPFFDIETQLAKLKEKNIDNNLNKIVEEVNARTPKEENCGWFNNLASSIGYFFVKQIEKYTPKMFYVDDKCISCGICKRVCPVSNITQEEKDKPIFGSSCESCLACIHNCPKNAIQMKIQRSEKRFCNSNVSLNEIIESNN